MGLRTFRKCFDNPGEHSVKRVIHIIVPEPDHPIAFRFDPASARFIPVGLRAMLASIEFDNKSG